MAAGIAAKQKTQLLSCNFDKQAEQKSKQAGVLLNNNMVLECSQVCDVVLPSLPGFRLEGLGFRV